MTVAGNSSSRGGMEPSREGGGTLLHVVETLLDKGLVLNADIMVSVAGVELLGIRLRAALASFETAARYGLEFPSGTNTDTVAWRSAIEEKESCPSCGMRAPLEQLLNDYCPWCGWESAQARRGDTRRIENGSAQGEEIEDQSAEDDESGEKVHRAIPVKGSAQSETDSGPRIEKQPVADPIVNEQSSSRETQKEKGPKQR